MSRSISLVCSARARSNRPRIAASPETHLPSPLDAPCRSRPRCWGSFGGRSHGVGLGALCAARAVRVRGWMPEPDDLLHQVRERLNEAVRGLPFKIGDFGDVEEFDLSEITVEEVLVTLLSALGDVVCLLAAEIDRLKSQGPPP